MTIPTVTELVVPVKSLTVCGILSLITECSSHPHSVLQTCCTYTVGNGEEEMCRGRAEEGKREVGKKKGNLAL